MSTYSPSLRIQLIATGDQAGTWGNTTNTNMGTLIESAIAGYVSVSVTSANQALTALDGVADESRNQTLALTTTTGANFAIYAPPAEKTYVIYNASAYTATIYNSTVLGNTTAAGAGVAIPTGKIMTVWSEGTNFAVQNTHTTSLTLGTPLAVTSGGTGGTTSTGSGAVVLATSPSITTPSISSPALTGTPTTPTAAPGTNTTQIASTAFVQAATSGLSLGTMATQNANNVAITGGSITGITDLAVADGGTGASDAGTARTNLGAAASGANSDITSLSGLTTPLSIAQGGTAATTASAARTSLGLGTIATQDASNVTITGGSITGITDLAIADGGTGSSTASGARTNLGLGTIATQNANSVAITGGSITGITDLAVADGGTGSSTAAGARTNLGLGTISTQDASSVTITGGSITGITDLAVADGGTGASTASGARTNLGLAIGTDVPSPTGTGASGTWNIGISGNAATATSATNATNATNLATTNFTIQESGGKLIFKYGATTIASLTSAGVFTALSDVSGGGTP